MQVHLTEAMNLSSRRRKFLDAEAVSKLRKCISAMNKMSVDIIAFRKCQTAIVSCRNTQVHV